MMLKPQHELPGKFWLDYILLPYGLFYDRTNKFLEAKPGDTMRFFNGPEVRIDKVILIENPAFCDILCRMRYGISWDKAFQKWLSYARMEGNGKDILDPKKCIMVVYENDTVQV